MSPIWLLPNPQCAAVVLLTFFGQSKFSLFSLLLISYSGKMTFGPSTPSETVFWLMQTVDKRLACLVHARAILTYLRSDRISKVNIATSPLSHTYWGLLTDAGCSSDTFFPSLTGCEETMQTFSGLNGHSCANLCIWKMPKYPTQK